MAITLDINGMTCSHCVHAVTKALKSVPGVKAVSVNLEVHRAQVDGSAEPNALIRAIEGEGYQAKVAAAP